MCARSAPRRSFRPSRILGWVAVLLAALVLAALVVFARSTAGAAHNFDTDAADGLNRYAGRHHGQVDAWRAVTTVGGPATWRVLAAAAVLALCARRRWRPAILIAVTMAGAAALSGVTKSLVNRHRPQVPLPVDRIAGGSFPSGHALTSFVAVGLLVVLVLPSLDGGWRGLLVVAAAVVVAAVGFSRLILGVHFVTDVVAGWLIAGLWLTSVLAVFRRSDACRSS